MATGTAEYDFILVGGGLQAGLLALAINHHQPQATVLIVEKNERLFGNHTWSFHETDLPESATWLDAIAYRRWPAYTVKFPKMERRINLAYCSFSSDQMGAAIQEIASRKQLQIRTRSNATIVDQHTLRIDGGQAVKIKTVNAEIFKAKTVVDCRGARPDLRTKCGFQKFHGFELELDRDWPEPLPVLMDASMDQCNGFRFLYVLPLTNRRVLVEDTHFSDSALLEREDSLAQVQHYLEQRLISNWSILREESGCLPMPFGSGSKPQASWPLSGGFGGGWFHAATGYSFPLAARFADTVATSPPGLVQQQVSELAQRNKFQAGFSRLLNRLLFQLVAPGNRFEIFQRFYRVLPQDTIGRFYSHQFTIYDAVRILIGSPPRGLTPFRFLKSFKALPCPSIQN